VNLDPISGLPDPIFKVSWKRGGKATLLIAASPRLKSSGSRQQPQARGIKIEVFFAMRQGSFASFLR
jgi:hypothetical protein